MGFETRDGYAGLFDQDGTMLFGVKIDSGPGDKITEMVDDFEAYMADAEGSDCFCCNDDEGCRSCGTTDPSSHGELCTADPLDRPATTSERKAFVDAVDERLKTKPWSEVRQSVEERRAQRRAHKRLFFTPWRIDLFPRAYLDVIRWVSADGTVRRPKEMDDEHLGNTIRWLERYYPKDHRSMLGYMILTYEQSLRGLSETGRTSPGLVRTTLKQLLADVTGAE